MVAINLEPLKDARLNSVLVGGWGYRRVNYQYLIIMAGLSIFLMILSIINYINLATASAIKSERGRSAQSIGCKQRNITFQFISETLVIVSFLFFSH
jgi:putative ABC transport system permease protein